MRPETLRTRGLMFAYLFGPPRAIDRATASQVHNRVCDELKLDDFSFRYTTGEPGLKEQSRSWAILMERPENRGRFRIAVDHAGGTKPLRVLMEYQWPISPDIDANERFDMAAKAVFEALPGEWRKVVAEVRLRTQCDAAGGNAAAYMTGRLLNLQGRRSEAMTPISFASTTLHSVPTELTTDPLTNPIREVMIEVLREDPRSLYMEYMARWTQAPPNARSVDPALLRPIDQDPSNYVEAAQDGLRAWAEAMA